MKLLKLIGLPVVLSGLAACGSHAQEAAPEAGSPATTGSTPIDEPPSPGATEREEPAPTTCVAPASGAPKSFTAGGVQTITLPAEITGRTDKGLELFTFKFVLTDVAKVRVRGSSPDFTDSNEAAAIGVSLVTKDGSGFSAQLAIYSKSIDKTSAQWLYPGEYELQISRSNAATANANAPILPHTFELLVEAEHPPVADAGCTLPDGVVSKTDVRATKACNDWCSKLLKCGATCRDDCDVPVGQCPASVTKQLECLGSAGLTCVSRNGGTGYSLDAICEADASVCDPADVRR